MRTDQIWQNRPVAESFLTGVQSAIPFATEQIDIDLHTYQMERPMRRVADLDWGDGAIVGTPGVQPSDTARDGEMGRLGDGSGDSPYWVSLCGEVIAIAI